MANFVFNVATGRVNKIALDSGDVRVLLVKAADARAVLQDLETVAAVLGNASTTEADFTNYARQAVTGLAPSIDHSNDLQFADCDDIQYTAAGGTTDNDVVGAIFFLQVTNDTDSVPLTFQDAVFSTNGSDVTLQINANGFFLASGT